MNKLLINTYLLIVCLCFTLSDIPFIVRHCLGLSHTPSDLQNLMYPATTGSNGWQLRYNQWHQINP
jgi:hypothetical protein